MKNRNGAWMSISNIKVILTYFKIFTSIYWTCLIIFCYFGRDNCDCHVYLSFHKTSQQQCSKHGLLVTHVIRCSSVITGIQHVLTLESLYYEHKSLYCMYKAETRCLTNYCNNQKVNSSQIHPHFLPAQSKLSFMYG